MSQVDRRLRKTRTALIDAFARLVADHDLGAISVQQICETADVARSSFYAHFNNKRELVTAVFGALEETLVEQSDPAYPGRFGFLPGLLAHIENRKGEGRARSRLLLQPDMLDEFRRFVLALVARALKSAEGEPEPTLLAFVGGGVLASIQSWLDGGCRQSPELLARDIEIITSHICPR